MKNGDAARHCAASHMYRDGAHELIIWTLPIIVWIIALEHEEPQASATEAQQAA